MSKLDFQLWLHRSGAWFSSPTGAAVLGMVAIFSTVFGIWSFVASKKERNLTYFVSAGRTAVVTAGKANTIQVSYKGEELTGDVSAVVLAVWNAGSEPIRSEDILDPIRVEVGGERRILETKLLWTSRPVTKFSVENDPGMAGKLSWQILEKNDGAMVQVTYQGDTHAPVSVKGVILGQNVPTLGDGLMTYKMAIPLILGALVVVSGSVSISIDLLKLQGGRKPFLIFLLGVAIPGVVMILYMYSPWKDRVPFEF